MAKSKVAETRPGKQSPLRWSSREVGQLMWLAATLRERRDPAATRFWEVAEMFGTTDHPIEGRQLRQVAARAFKREYGRVLKITRSIKLPKAVA